MNNSVTISEHISLNAHSMKLNTTILILKRLYLYS